MHVHVMPACMCVHVCVSHNPSPSTDEMDVAFLPDGEEWPPQVAPRKEGKKGGEKNEKKRKKKRI